MAHTLSYARLRFSRASLIDGLKIARGGLALINPAGSLQIFCLFLVFILVVVLGFGMVLVTVGRGTVFVFLFSIF